MGEWVINWQHFRQRSLLGYLPIKIMTVRYYDTFQLVWSRKSFSLILLGKEICSCLWHTCEAVPLKVTSPQQSGRWWAGLCSAECPRWCWWYDAVPPLLGRLFRVSAAIAYRTNLTSLVAPQINFVGSRSVVSGVQWAKYQFGTWTILQQIRNKLTDNSRSVDF